MEFTVTRNFLVIQVYWIYNANNNNPTTNNNEAIKDAPESAYSSPVGAVASPVVALVDEVAATDPVVVVLPVVVDGGEETAKSDWMFTLALFKVLFPFVHVTAIVA